MADDIGPMSLPGVYRAIAAVMEDVGKDGIAKDRKNQQQGYNFRGIDDVYNALAPILARHHLIIVPRVLSREKTERETQKGGVLFYVVVHVEFEIICSTDGSRITASTYGEAMDSADKATNKAMSAAYKYMAMQTFCIPTEGDNDADASHHEVKAKTRAPTPTPSAARGKLTAPEKPGQAETSPEQSSHSVKHSFNVTGYDDGHGPGKSASQAKKDGDWDRVRERLLEEMGEQATRADCEAWWKKLVKEDAEYQALPKSFRQMLYETDYLPHLEDLPEVVG